MKKILSGILAFAMMASIGTISFAGPAQNAASTVSALKANLQEIKDKSQTIRDNEKALMELRKSVLTAINSVKEKVKTLKENETTLTQAQIDSLKAALSSIKTARKTLAANHFGKIAKIRLEMPKARQDIRNKADYTAILENFDAILAEQASRKADLQKVLDAINSIVI